MGPGEPRGPGMATLLCTVLGGPSVVLVNLSEPTDARSTVP